MFSDLSGRQAMKDLVEPRFPKTDLDYGLAVCDNMDFLKQFRDESVKLIVTSPPYNIGKSYEQRRPLERYLEDQTTVIRECARILAQDGSICWQVGNHVDEGEVFPLDALLYPVFKSFGMQLRNRIVWHFGHGLHCTKRFSFPHEEAKQ